MRLSNSALGNGVGGANGKPIVVRNVVVENVGANGVSFSPGSVLENVTVRGAGADGFNGNGESVLRACVAAGCGGRGFHTAHGATLEGCTADRNDEAGFELGPASVLRGCRAAANGFGGRDRSRPRLPEGVTPIGVSGRVPHPFDGCTDPEIVDRRTGAPLPGLVNLGRGGHGERTPTSGFDGIRVDVDSLVVDCVSSGNFDDGIAAGARSTVSRCTANDNNAGGISAGSFSVIDGSTASGNGAAGVTVGVRSRVTGCHAAGNTLTGFVIDDLGVAERCVAMTNGGRGIELDTGGAARECDASNNSGAGIQAHGNDTLVFGCTSRANLHAGIEIRPGSGSRVEMNHICNNVAAGILINGSFALVVRNHLELDWISNASGSASNTIGPIVGPGADLSTVGPWANMVLE